jgi:C4-dicarboxylate transporter DctM subunit
MFAVHVFVAFFVIALAGVPLVYALLVTTIGMIWVKGLSHPLETIFLSYIGGVEPFILIAVPLFVFAGEILSQGGVGKRIVELARVLFGFLPGGLGVVTIASCLMFGGVSGSAIADTAAIGSLIIPTMIQRGYSRAFAAALLAVAGTLALLMPLSIPFLVYAFISGVSMRTLSMSGVIPAFISALALVAVCIWYGKKTGCDAGSERASRTEIWRALKAAGPALLMPVIIVGGIWSGYFTPTESAAVAVVYGLVVSLFLYRDITWRDLPRLLLAAFQTSAVVMLVLGATAAMAWLLTAEQVAMQLAEWVKVVAQQALLLTAPLFLPLAKAFNVDLVHLGVVMTANLAIALYTPPVGGTLFVAAKLANAGIGAITRALIPLMTATVLVLLLITYVPALSTTLVRLILN